MISLYDMLEAADGQLFGEPVAQIFTDFAIEIDQVQPGCLFVALQTERSDGLLYLKEAVDRGALGIVSTVPPDFDTAGVTMMIVKDPEKALMEWARVVMRKFGTTVIAVTGSTGKSTTREAIAAVLGARYNVYNGGNKLRGRLGLPLSLGKLTAQHQLAVLEFSAEQSGEIAEMVDITQPLVGVVTNISATHGGRLGSAEAAAREMAGLIDALPDGGLAVLNYDDPLVRAMGVDIAASVFSIGIDSFDADLMAFNVVNGRYKTGFDLRYGPERFVGRWVPLLGSHQLYAAMAAFAVGLSYQVAFESGMRALTQVEPLPGRMRPLTGHNGCLLVDDTFKSSPESTSAALNWLKVIRKDNGRVILVLGDMDHLGNYAHQAHRQVGEQVAWVADVLVTVGNMAAIAGRAALDFGLKRSQLHMTYGAHDAVAVLRDQLRSDDVVLVKGSSGQLHHVVKLLLGDSSDTTFLVEPAGPEDARVTNQRSQASWVEVDREVTAQNVRAIKELLGPDVALMAFVAADAYGHGAVNVASTAMLNGAEYLVVSSLEEAVALRDAGIDAPVLVMGHIPNWAVRDALRYELTVVLPDLRAARVYNRVAGELGRELRVHINIDTGMGRLGFMPSELMQLFRGIRMLKNLTVEGIFTELASSDQDLDYTRKQLKLFKDQLSPLRATGMEFKYVHAADTAALLTIPESKFNAVRVGSILYGLTPTLRIPLPEGIKPTMSWKTAVAQVKTLPQGSFVGDGKEYWVANGEERIAVIPVGFADGFRAESRHWREVLVGGARIPVIGRAGPHEAALNVTHFPAVQAGDEVVIIGQQGDENITVHEVAGWLKCTVRELLTTVLPQMPRS